MPGAAGGQDIQYAIEQPTRVTPGSADVRLYWWEVFLNNPPQFLVIFSEGYELNFYFMRLIFLGPLLSYIGDMIWTSKGVVKEIPVLRHLV